jgi:hypothetical protein
VLRSEIVEFEMNELRESSGRVYESLWNGQKKIPRAISCSSKNRPANFSDTEKWQIGKLITSKLSHSVK